MPGMRCTVGVCNNSRLGVKQSGKEVCFYRFPKNKSLRQIWVQKCKRGGKWDPENCRVCSEHFTEEDYERDLQAELLNLPAKRILKTIGKYKNTLNNGPSFPKTGFLNVKIVKSLL